MKTRILTAALFLLPVALGGCRALALVLPEKTKTVAAEYPYLAGKRVAVAVWADMETLCTYPQVQWSVADHVRAALEANIREVDVVDPRKIVDIQRSDAKWESADPALLGRRFDADRLIEIQLTQYTTREPESPHLYRGHIAAAVRVYNTEYTQSEPAYQTDVHTVFPPDGPGQWGSSDQDIRRATMEAFADELTGRFFDRKIKVR